MNRLIHPEESQRKPELGECYSLCCCGNMHSVDMTVVLLTCTNSCDTLCPAEKTIFLKPVTPTMWRRSDDKNRVDQFPNTAGYNPQCESEVIWP